MLNTVFGDCICYNSLLTVCPVRSLRHGQKSCSWKFVGPDSSCAPCCSVLPALGVLCENKVGFRGRVLVLGVCLFAVWIGHPLWSWWPTNLFWKWSDANLALRSFSTYVKQNQSCPYPSYSSVPVEQKRQALNHPAAGACGLKHIQTQSHFVGP